MRALLPLVLLLSACSVGPDYGVPGFAAMPARWLGGAVSSEGNTPDTAYWHAFHDHTLNALVRFALLHNDDAKIAQARIAEARAALGGARAQLLPTIGGSVSGERANSSNGRAEVNTGTFQSGFDASWELDLFGGNRRAKEAAAATVDAEEAALDQVKVSLVAEVVRTYLDVRRLSAQLENVTANIGYQNRVLEAVSAQFEEGVASKLDLARIQSQTATTRALVPDLEAEHDATRNALALLLGTTPQDVRDHLPAGHIPQMSGTVVLSQPASVIANRPDVRAAERQLAAATANIGVATARWFPKISLAGLFGLTDSTLLGSYDAWSTSARLAMPLLDFGKVRALVDQAKAREQQALFRYEKAIKAALADVETSLSHHMAAQRRVTIVDEAATAAATAETIARAQFREGLVSLTDLLDAQRQLLDAQLRAAQARAQLGQTYAALYKALGGLPTQTDDPPLQVGQN